MTLRSFAAVVLLLMAGMAFAETRTREQTFTYTLLTHENRNFVVMGAKAIERNPQLAPDVLDVTAAVLSERLENPSSAADEMDASAWLIRVLGAGGQLRHRPVVEQAISAYRHKKIDKYANLALARMTLGNPSPLVEIDMSTLRQQLQAERDAMRGITPRPSATEIAAGTPLETVLAEYGYPDRNDENIRTAGFMYVRVDSHSVRLHYEGIGMLDIAYGTAPGQTWVVHRFLPSLSDSYAGKHPQEAMALDTGNNRELLETAIGLSRAGVRESELLDIVAGRIQRSMGSRDVYEIKALAHLCRLLGASGDPKYAALLQNVRENGADNALRRHARHGLNELQGK